MTRRIVTGVSPDGKPIIVSDGPPPRSRTHVATPGMANTLVWSTASPPQRAAEDQTSELASWVPGPGETVALVVTFPPDSVFSDQTFDPAAAHAENLVAVPGLAELFEQDAPGMHTTPTVDYGVVLEGQIVLDLETESTALQPGDVVVQNGTRHAWRNPTDEPATVFFVLLGAAPG
jgi:mannose-6-phosphate isomerase-like protein (cupin superfamily)